MSDFVIDIQHLGRSFGKTEALQDVSLQVPRGEVFGLIGSNGAGKTTLIKHILGSHYAQRGWVKVFGLDPVAEPVKVLGRIGYMSEDRDVPSWMRIGELIDFTRTFYPAWDSGYATELTSVFELDVKQKIRDLSRGQTARVCLLLALSHRPELLVLDEPSSGLDPVIRRDILAAIVRTTTDEGRTVLFSSHLLDEVERLADRVAILHQGRILLDQKLEDIYESYHRVTLRFDRSFSIAPALEGSLHSDGNGNEWTYVVRGQKDQLLAASSQLNATVVAELPLSLDDIFVCNIQGH
jgi:ABC-2 type transport system ATP-binding protein